MGFRPDDPFAPANPIFIAPGMLSGSGVPGCNRTAVTVACSPLTGLFGDGHVGGRAGKSLKWAGCDQLVLVGESPRPVYLWLDSDRARLEDAAPIWGSLVSRADEYIREQKGRNSSIIAIGPAGENRAAASAIIADRERAAAATGAAAVLGAKKIKAIAVAGTKKPRPFDGQRLEDLCRRLDADIKKAPFYHRWRNFGTSFLVNLFSDAGTLPTRNFQTGVFSGSPALRSEILNRYVTKSESCYACPVGCHKICRLKSGSYAGLVAKRPEYEALSGFGSMCGVSSLPAIIYMNALANDLGLDVVQSSKSISCAMHWWQDGIIRAGDTDGLDLAWGKEASVIKLLGEMAHRKGFGALLADGAVRAAERISDLKGLNATLLARYVIQTKGMAHSSVELRTSRGIALAYGVASRGGDHLRGHATQERYAAMYPNPGDWAKIGVPIEEAQEWHRTKALDAGRYTGKGKLVKWMEDLFAVADSLGLCKFLTPWQNMPFGPGYMAEVVTAFTGLEYTVADIMCSGERICNVERLVQIGNGVSSASDNLPERLFEEPLPEGPGKGAVLNRESYRKVLDEYYAGRGWHDGVPSADKLRELGLAAHS